MTIDLDKLTDQELMALEKQVHDRTISRKCNAWAVLLSQMKSYVDTFGPICIQPVGRASFDVETIQGGVPGVLSVKVR